jgi:hypothetical protein
MRSVKEENATSNVIVVIALEKFVASQVREGTYRNLQVAIFAAVSHQKRRRRRWKITHYLFAENTNV